jgi:RNA polymerase sigma-70 factor (ECF subfamily)
MTDNAWIGQSLKASRPHSVVALLRYFRDLGLAEETFQEASLRAVQQWTVSGPPRDPVAWLVLVGRNAGIDELRQRNKAEELPPEELIADLGDAETPLVERLDQQRYRDDMLGLLFACCHPDLPATQQIALALRVVSGLTVTEIARAFLVSESAMERRITRAKRQVAAANIPFEAPGSIERGRRLGAVMTTIYLLFNEGYAASGGATDGGASGRALDGVFSLSRRSWCAADAAGPTRGVACSLRYN